MSAKSRPEPKVALEGPAVTYALFGHDAALAQVAHAVRSGNLPQAWLIGGSPGIGKATLAFRVARYLLRYGATDGGAADLSVSPDDRVSHQIAAGAHPGLMVVRRTFDDKGKLRTVIRVEEIRELSGLFGLTSADGGWRVAIIDTADEMNENAANALLKMLEEPPPRSLFLLISHAPGKLLPTIRSRTQRLHLRPLAAADMAKALAALLPELDKAEHAVLAELSEGSPGLAMQLADEGLLKLAEGAGSLVERKKRAAMSALFTLADRVARAEDGLDHFGAFLSAALARRIRERALRSEQGLDRWVELWERLNETYERATLVHLEPRQTVLNTALSIEAVKRRERGTGNGE
jgi:DNA polymerase-3 subunit delta'